MDFWKSLAPRGRIYFCEECGSECEYYYWQDGLIIGCENCISKNFVWEK